jgi:4-amino-4-deoxy-L-arabinose transferase-like glycosyltransferase
VNRPNPVARESGPKTQAAGATDRPLPLVIALIAIAELAWLAWFLIVPLPNINNVGVPSEKAVRRGVLLLKTFPHVVPGTLFRDSLLGKGINQLSHLENLPQRVPIILAAGLIAAAAVGLGDLVLRGLRVEAALNVLERIAIDYGLGAGLLGVITLLIGRLGQLDPWLFRVGLGLLAVAGLAGSAVWRAGRPRMDASSWPLVLLFAPFVLVMILGSMLPAIDFDVLEYHLQGPKEYYQAGRIAFLPHNVYTSMPFGVEMLHLMGMEVLADFWWGGLAGQLLIALFAPAAAVLIAATASRGGSARAAWIAAIVYLSTPWIYRLAVIAYIEGPLCFYHAALLWAVVRGWADRAVSRRRIWFAIGLLAGCAMGCKYPALISAVVPFGALALWDCRRSRSLAPLTFYVLGWAIVMGPWLVKNVIDTGNPVYPLADSIFHSRHWDRALEQKWSDAHGRRSVTYQELFVSLIDVAGRSDWQSPLYVALAPLALFRSGSRRLALAIWGLVAYLFVTWWLLTHRLDRFWLPLLPASAILAGLGADWVRNRAWSLVLGVIMAIALLMNLTYITSSLAGPDDWTGDLDFLRRDVPRRWNAPLASLDTELPANARPLMVGQAAVFHLAHPVVYNTVFNPETIELLASGRNNDEFHDLLRQRKLTHIYVDWYEIQRHRKPGGYGFTDFVTPSRFAQWVAAGVLERPVLLGPQQQLYQVR